jgi:hypothetical protein
MKIFKWLKKHKSGICVVIGMLAFFSLSGVEAPANGNGALQGVIAVLIMTACVVIGTWGEGSNENNNE